MATKYAPHARDHRARALSWVGRSYPPGWCLRFQVIEIFGVPGVGDYDGDRAADAEDYWKAAVARGRVVKTSNPDKIPAGALIMWVDPNRPDYGHAAYSLGSGWMVSTDLPTSGKVGRVRVSDVARKWGHKLVGYVVVDGNGYTLNKPPKKVTKTTYIVTAKTGLRGRSSASTSAPTKRVAKHGSKVVGVKTVSGSGLRWVVTADGLHYAAKHLRKVAK